MAGNQIFWDDMKREERLRHQLFLQSQQIERVFSEHRVTARISGGEVAPQSIRFDLGTQLEQGWERLRQLKQELLNVLGVPDLQFVRDEGGWRLHLSRPAEPPVALLDLLPLLPDLPSLTAVLGLDETGHPLLVQLDAADVGHLLIGGGSRAGKSTLLRSMLLSLAIGSRQSRCQLFIADPDLPDRPSSRQLAPALYLPHFQDPPAQSVEDAAQLFAFLADELEFRQNNQQLTPAIVVAVEEVVTLMELGGEAVVVPLKQLLHKGAAVGIHLFLTTRQPRSPLLDQPFRANIPLWIYGAGVEAESGMTLLGDGDFLAVVDGFQTHFQAAYIGSYDSHLVLARLRERRRQSLLAEPLPDEEGAEPPADPAAGAPVAMRTVPPAAPTGDMQPNAGV